MHRHLPPPASKEAGPERRTRILFFAYACEPGSGSEPGAGWGIVRTVARFADCTVLVSPEHRPGIDRWRREGGDPHIRFVEVPEARGFQSSTSRVGRFMRYLRWLPGARRTAASLNQQRKFDLVWHVTYSTYWLPTPATRLGVPCILGPLGGAVVAPRELHGVLGWRGLLTEWLDLAVVRTCSALPSTRRTWRAAEILIAQNEDTLSRLPDALRARAMVINHALFAQPAHRERTQWDPEQAHCVVVSALESRKGVALAIQALAHTQGDFTLTIIGDGPERSRLERLAAQLGVTDRIQFRGRVDRSEVAAALSTARAAVFTGLREEGGLALAEALMAGVPVVVLAHGGARTIVESAADPSRVAPIPPGPVDEVARSIGAAMTRFARSPYRHTSPNLAPGCAAATLRSLVESSLLRRRYEDAGRTNVSTSFQVQNP